MSGDTEQHFLAYRARVYRWAVALGARHDDALDVVQDVFVRMLRSRPVFAEPGAAVGWLRRVTNHVLIDRWRRPSVPLRDASLELTAPPAGPPLESVEQARRLSDLLADLSEQQRLVVICKCFDGMTFAQIAAELGLSLGTVKTHYLRALHALRSRLRPGDPSASPRAAQEAKP
jgi:RNA polymerase sigma-70 factor (ECF subfamily)